MKKLLTLLFLVPTILFGQTTLKQAITNGSTAGGLSTTNWGNMGLGTSSSLSGSLTFKNATNANALFLTSGITSATYTLTLPTAQGAASTFLQNDGSGVLSWGSPEAPLTFSTGLTRSINTITANLSTGVSGGQTAIGGTAASNNLTLSTTTNGTKGKIIFGSASAYDEANDRIGIGTISPSSSLHVNGIARFGLASTTNASLIFQNSTNANTLTVNSGVTSASYALTWPTAQGGASTVLTNDGSGGLSWMSAAAMGTWLITGNAGTSIPSNFLGTTDSRSMRFRTNNVQRMIIDSVGNVGINTTMPFAKLQIDGIASNVVESYYNPNWGNQYRWQWEDDAGTFRLLANGHIPLRFYAGTQTEVNGGNTGLAFSVVGFDDLSTSNLVQFVGASGVAGRFFMNNFGDTYIGINTGSENVRLKVIGSGSTSATYNTIIKNSADAIGLAVTGDNRVFGTALHNNAGSVTGTTNQYIASGTYTATLTNVTNIAASTPYQAQWMRVGNVVTVSGKVDIDVTLAASAASELGMSLPIASNFTAEENLGGDANSDALASEVARIKADATNDRASFVFKAISITNDSYAFSFTYLIQ